MHKSCKNISLILQFPKVHNFFYKGIKKKINPNSPDKHYFFLSAKTYDSGILEKFLKNLLISAFIINNSWIILITYRMLDSETKGMAAEVLMNFCWILDEFFFKEFDPIVLISSFLSCTMHSKPNLMATSEGEEFFSTSKADGFA